MKQVKVARIATVPMFFQVYKHQFEALNKDFDLTLITSADDDFIKLAKMKVNHTHAIDIPRNIQPLNDLISLGKLYRHFRNSRYSITHSTTPKAGLLVAIAAFFARVPTRLHTYTGQRWVTLTGVKRAILILADKLIGMLNTHLYADSHSQMDSLIQLNICDAQKISVIHRGSFAGIDLERFNYEQLINQKDQTRKELNISTNDRVIIFVGRIVKDKGIVELIESFKQLSIRIKDLKLLIVGPYEEALDPIPSEIRKEIENNDLIMTTGMKSDPEKYLAAADLFCIPSYREGFGSSALEAAALKIPSVGTNIVGLRDAISNNETGILVPLHNIDQLTMALTTMIEDSHKREQMGQAAYDRVLNDFNQKIISKKIIEEYKAFLEGHKDEQ